MTTGEEPRCIYVLHGDDAYLLDSHRREITARVVGDADPQVCVSTFDGTEEAATVLDELRTLPFLAPRRLVVVRGADAFVSANRQVLERFFQSPPSSSTLLLIVSSWRSNTRLAKLVARIGEVIDCSVPAKGNLPRWLAKGAARRGKKLAPDAAELLAQWIGADLAALDGELEKLALYVGERERIAAEDVSAVVTASAGAGAFDLTNAITAGDAPAALRVLGGLLQTRGEEFRTLGLIAWHLRRALEAKEKLLAGVPARQALPRMPRQQAGPFQAMLQRRSLRAFQEDFRRLIRADLAMKSGVRPVAAMQELVIGLCS